MVSSHRNRMVTTKTISNRDNPPKTCSKSNLDKLIIETNQHRAGVSGSFSVTLCTYASDEITFLSGFHKCR